MLLIFSPSNTYISLPVSSKVPTDLHFGTFHSSTSGFPILLGPSLFSNSILYLRTFLSLQTPFYSVNHTDFVNTYTTPTSAPSICFCLLGSFIRYWFDSLQDKQESSYRRGTGSSLSPPKRSRLVSDV